MCLQAFLGNQQKIKFPTFFCCSLSTPDFDGKCDAYLYWFDGMNHDIAQTQFKIEKFMRNFSPSLHTHFLFKF